MGFLETLRNHRAIVRWMLVWLALSMGVAVASPIVQPKSMALVCSAAGALQWVSADDAADATITPTMVHTLDCVLCLAAGSPRAEPVAWGVPRAENHTPAPPRARHIALLARAPATARGPPAQS